MMMEMEAPLSLEEESLLVDKPYQEDGQLPYWTPQRPSYENNHAWRPSSGMTDGLWDEEYYFYNKNTHLDNKTVEEQLMEALLKGLEESGQLDEFLYYVKKFGLKAALEHLSELFPQVLKRLEKSGFLPLLELVLNKLDSQEVLEKLGNALIEMLKKLGRTAQAEELKRLLKQGVLTKEDQEEAFAQALEEALE